MLCYNSQPFFGCGGAAFELGIFGGFEHGLELRTGTVAGGDEVAAGDEEFGLDVLCGGGLVLLLGEVVEA